MVKDYSIRAILTIGGDSVSVVRVVVVQHSTRVHIALVVRVPRVRGTEPTVPRRAEKIAPALLYLLVFFFVGLNPGF